MAEKKRRGLGRGIAALIPSEAEAAATASPEGATGKSTSTRRGTSRPVDVFFSGSTAEPEVTDEISIEQSRGSSSRKPSGSDSSGSQNRGSGTRGTRPAGSTAKSSTGTATSGKKSSAGSRAGAKVDPADSGVPSSDSTDLGDGTDSTAASQFLPGTELVPVPGASFAEIPVGEIVPNRKQPRTVFDEEAMAELVHSVKEIGVLQPIVVRPLTESVPGKSFELIMGERRWRATQLAGLATVPAIVRTTSDDDLLRDALLENLHRSQLNPLEEGAAYRQLLDDFGISHDTLADRIGRSRSQVSNTLRLLNLPPLVQKRVAAGVLSAGHARALLGFSSAPQMEQLAQRIVAEGLSVRTTEEIVATTAGENRKQRRSLPRAGSRHERLDYLEQSLGDKFETSVKISLGAKKGKVTIDFATVDDLNRIVDIINAEN